MFHVTVWKDQAVGAQERMEDTIIVCVSDEGVHGEHSKFCLNEDSENMETLNREVSSLGTEGCNKDIHAEEEMFKEGVVVASEAFEILIRNGVTDDNNKGSRTLQCFDIDDDLDEKYIKELNSTLKIPHFEALGKNEKLYNVKSCLEVQCPEESVTLQGSKLRGLDAFKTEFHLNSEETKRKELLTQMDFSGTLLNSWEQGTHSRLPVIGGGDCLSLDLEEEKDLLSFHITACREQVAGKKVRETHTNDSVSNEEQSEQSAVTLKVVNQNKMSSESEVRVSGEGSSYNRCPCIREIKANETDVREKLIVDGRASESPKQNYDNDKRRNRTIPIKHCCVVLKDLRDELNEKYEDSLISLDTEIQSLKRQNERKASFSDPTQVTLHDVLDENDVKKQSTIINIKALLENEKLDNTEKKEIKSPEEVVTSRGSNSMDIEIHHSAEESQIKGSLVQMNSPDLSDMVEEGIFTRLSLMEEEYKSSSINIFHMEEEDQGERRLQLDSCLVSNMTSEVQKEKQREVVPGAMFMKHWNKPTEQLEREVLPSSSLVKNPNRKGFNSRFSGGLFTSNISQSSTIILAPGNALQTEDLQGIPVEGTSPCLSVNRTESVLGEGKPHNRSPLLPVSEEDIHVTVWEPSCISPPAVEKLETNQKGELISPVKSQVPRVESLVQYSLEESAEEVSQGQLIVEELKSLSKRDFKSSYESDDSSCFVTEGAEDFDNVNVNVTDGQNKAVQPETRGEHLNPSKVTLQLQSMEVPVSCRNMAECHSCMADIKKIKHSDIKKSTALHCPEQNRDGHIGYVEKEMNLEPAKETCHVGKMSGPVVRLLGVSSKACKPRRLKRLVELEDSSDDEACVCCQSTQKMSRPVLRVSSSKTCKPCKMQRVEELKDLSDDVFADVQVSQEIKDSDYHPTCSKKEMRQFLKPYAAHVLWQKPLNSHDSNVKKRKCRKSASKEASPSASVSSLQLSEEQSRTKVMNSLHGMLQKRLEESPDLDVHEDTILRLANNLEKEIFNLFLCVDHRYKNKYRSLLFNLKAPKNKLLFHQVVLGEVSPQCLVQMNSLEMAPKELAEWRAKESKHVLEVIEKQQREAPKRRPTKLTHKGEIEIHQEVDDDCTLEDLYGSALYVDKKPTSPPAAKSKRDTTDQHKSHLLDPDCLICTGRMAPDGERGFNPPQMKSASKKKSDSSTRLPATTGYSEKGRKNLEKDRPASTGILKKNPRLQKQAKDIVLWEGLIQMFSIKQFAAKAYPVSGYGSHLIQALPELIQSRGCILPEDVWGYLDSIWPGEAKEMSVIQFWPAMTKDFSTYNMLYSYLNNKQRYGIVDSNQMEMFMVPLPAFQPVPAKFHVLGGPGLDSHHSCLLLGLILPKKVSGSSSANSMGLSLLKETKRKRVTFKNNLVSKHSSPPLHSSGSAKLAEPPQQIPSMAFTGEWPSRNEYPPSGSHSQELLTNNDIFALQTAVDEVLNGWTSHETSSHCQNREKGTNQSVQNCAFHSFSNLFCVGGQSHSMAEESLGRQQNVTGGHAEFQADAGPATSQNWNFGPLSSWSLCSHECGGNVALNANMLDIEQLSSILYPGVTSSGVSQVPAVPRLVSHESSAISEVQNHAAIGETNPTLPMEEALSLIQHLEALVQLNAQIQNQILFSLPSLDLPATLQATTPGESQIVGGSTFPLIPQESSVYPNSQSTLPPFSGPVYPPSGC